jgi:hypothetical protein
MSTITREEIETLAGQRDAQVAAVENAFMKEHGARKPLHVSTLKTWARVTLGGVDCALPIRRLLKWAATFDKGAEFRIGMSDDKRNVCFVSGSSSLKLAMREDVWSEELPAHSAPAKEELGEAIVIAESESGVLTVQRAFSDADKAYLRQAKGEAKAVAEANKARLAVKAAKSQMTAAVKAHHANIAAMSGGKRAAIAVAKATRDTWREVRRAKANPMTLPAWGNWQAEKGDVAVIMAQKHAADVEYDNFTRGNLGAITKRIGKLREKLTVAQRDLNNRIALDGRLYCESLGVPTRYASRIYSRARLAVKQWPDKKAALSIALIDALETYRKCTAGKVKPLPVAPPVAVKTMPACAQCGCDVSDPDRAYHAAGCMSEEVAPPVAVSESPVAPDLAPVGGTRTAEIAFESYGDAKAFARKWAIKTLRGYALSKKGESGGATLTLYRVTESEAQWIDAEVAAQATETPIPATPEPISAPIAPLTESGEEIESFTYLDTPEEINRKMNVLTRNRGKLLASIAEALASPERMARMQKWQNRSAKEWLRNEIVKLCHTARSWALSNGMGSGLCHRDKATDKQLAARRFLIAELNIWREARRIYLASIAPPPPAVNVPPLAVCEREEPIPATKAALDEVFSSFPSLRALFAREKEHIIPFPDQHEGEWREAVNGKAVSA